MGTYRSGLPQLSGDLFLTDAGIETDLIFNRGVEIREFAAHTLLPDKRGREELERYLRGFLNLAKDSGTGFILDSQTWKAHMHWSDDLKEDEDALREANFEAIRFISRLRDEFRDIMGPIVLNGVVGPRGDAYSPDADVAAHDAEAYHSKQIGWLAETDVDMVTGLTFTQSSEATGFVRTARAAGLPVVISFTVETDGCLPTGQPLGEAVRHVDDETNAAASYFMVNCAHPDHFFSVFDDGDWVKRIRGLRCNASRLSHAELDECETLDHGDAEELADQYKEICQRMPWLNVFGGCCGTDLRHVSRIARAVVGEAAI